MQYHICHLDSMQFALAKHTLAVADSFLKHAVLLDHIAGILEKQADNDKIRILLLIF